MSPEAPIITVVIPTYNRRHVIERAVHSVLGQGMARLELIVVDDGSTDGTAELLANIEDPRLSVIVQANGGVCVARNTGITAASCDFITFLDSDDEAGDGWLQFYAGAVEAGYDLASCAVHFVGPGSLYQLVLTEPSDRALGNIRARFLPGAFGLRRTLLTEVGAFRPGLRFSEHTDLALRLGGRMLDSPFRVISVDKPLLTMHRDERPYDAALQHESSITLLREDEGHLRRSPTLHATYFGIAGVAASRLGRHREARNLLARAIRIEPTRLKHYLRLGRELLHRLRQ